MSDSADYKFDCLNQLIQTIQRDSHLVEKFLGLDNGFDFTFISQDRLTEALRGLSAIVDLVKVVERWQ